MAEEYGLSEQSASLLQVAANGDVREEYLLVAAGATVAPGQVYEFDPAGNNYVDYAGPTAPHYAVCNAAAAAHASEGRIRCIITGEVYISELDPTADADMVAALRAVNINPVANGTV